MTASLRTRRIRLVAAVLAIPFSAVLLVLSFLPQHVEEAAPEAVFGTLDHLRQLLGAEWLTFAVAEVAANVILYVPVGALTALLLPARLGLLSIAVGPALSATVELIQLTLLPGRTPSGWDVLANSVGALAGAAFVLLLRRSSPSPAAVA